MRTDGFLQFLCLQTSLENSTFKSKDVTADVKTDIFTINSNLVNLECCTTKQASRLVQDARKESGGVCVSDRTYDT